MAPIFATRNVQFKDIGEVMHKHIDDNNLSEKDKTLLVGGLISGLRNSSPIHRNCIKSTFTKDSASFLFKHLLCYQLIRQPAA